MMASGASLDERCHHEGQTDKHRHVREDRKRSSEKKKKKKEKRERDEEKSGSSGKRKKTGRKERQKQSRGGTLQEKALEKIADAFRYTKSGNVGKLARVLDRLEGMGLGPDSPDDRGWTCLHHACNLNDQRITSCLLSAGADGGRSDPLGNSPAHLAARHCNMELLEELLYAASPADMEAKNSQEYTPRLIMLEALAARKAREVAARAAAETRRKAMEEEEWRSRLSDAAQDDFFASGAWMGEEDEWGDRQPSGEAGPPGGMDDEEYRVHMVREMARRRASAHHPAGAQPGTQPSSSARESHKRRQDEQEKKEKHWREVLKEEVARDKAWREGVIQGRSNAELREDYERRWQAFLLRERPPGTVGNAEVPWVVPPGKWKEKVPGVVLSGLAAGDSAARKKRLRMELMRWHPDKFRSRFYQCLTPADAEIVMQDVTELSAVLTALNSE